MGTDILRRAKTLARYADRLHSEIIEPTLSPGGVRILAVEIASLANEICDALPPSDVLRARRQLSEATDALLGEGRR